MIDDKKIFLHANFTRDCRTLRIAEDYPDKFAAIDLYAPAYERNFKSKWSMSRRPSQHIAKMKSIPMFIHYDPIDTLSPYSQLRALIQDCKKNDIPLTLSAKRNSGLCYNVALIGEEAMDFFANVE